MIARISICLAAGMLLAFFPLAGRAGSVPPANIVLTPIATGAGQPVMLTEPDDASGRLFVVDRKGSIRIIEHGKLLAQPYLSINAPQSGEQGLVGMAFDPDFASNGIFYLTFTAPDSEGQLGAMQDQVLARFTASDPAANVFAGVRKDVLRIPDIYDNHNGGDIHFGPDGYLYWGMGDGGSGGDPHDFSQNLWKKQVPAGTGPYYYLLGKMIRIDVRHGTSIATSETCGGAAGTTLEYRIPADNPFVGSSQTCDEIYQLGLRNPWRFSFDRASAEIFIADVGQGCWEEVNVLANGTKGHNFGWRLDEGHAVYVGLHDCSGGPASVDSPVFDYSHSDGCSITGGYVYRGPDSALDGLYFYGDFCDSTLFYAEPGSNHWHDGSGITGTPLSTGLDLGSVPVGFGEDLAGRVYVTLSNGTIYRIDSDAIFANGFEP